MPVPIQSGVITAMSSDTITASEIEFNINDNNGVLLGTLSYVAPTWTFIQGSLSSDSQHFATLEATLNAGGSLGFLSGETLSITLNSVVYSIPLFPSLPESIELFLDTQGTLFTDASYIGVYDGDGSITTESITSADITDEVLPDETYNTLYVNDRVDANKDVSDETIESIILSDTNAIEEVEDSTVEYINLIELIDLDDEVERSDTLIILDSTYTESEERTLDEINISEDAEEMGDSSDEVLSITDYQISEYSDSATPLVRYQLPDYPMNDVVLQSLSEPYSDSRFFRFGPFDFGTTSLKHLAVIELATKSDNNIYVCLEYNYNFGSTYRTSKFVKLSKKGFAHIPITAVNFNVIVLTIGKDLLKFDYLKLAHKFVDRSSTRGI